MPSRLDIDPTAVLDQLLAEDAGGNVAHLQLRNIDTINDILFAENRLHLHRRSKDLLLTRQFARKPSSDALMEPLNDDERQLLLSPRVRRSTPTSHAQSHMVFEPPPLRRDAGGNSLHFTKQPSVQSPADETLPITANGASPRGYSPYGTTRLSMESWGSHHDAADPLNGWEQSVTDALHAAPCIAIAVLVNLMICVPFGLSFFPVEWQDNPMPRALGIQMFLLSSTICQFTFVWLSNFDGAICQMMVENVPFMHTISVAIIQELGPTNPSVLPTILVTYAFSSVVCGALFYVLGHWKLGNIVYLFPKHIIVGAVGGIGAFVLQSGIENATGRGFDWSWDGVKGLFDEEIVWLWVSSALLAVMLWVLARHIKSPLFPPLFFVSIPPLFYVTLLLLGISTETARDHGWFFSRAPHVAFYALWEQYDFSLVAWHVIPKQFGTIVGLTFFSLMHVPINIPSLSLTTDKEVDINDELVAHGISNTLSGVCGTVQNYLCYSTSALYYKCGGAGRRSGFVIGIIMGFFFFVGPNAVSYIPRCMAGCVMMHLGWDLLREALIDTYDQLDALELGTVWAIAGTMTFWGMNQGLAVGALLACMTFVMQSARTPTNAPIRGSMSAATLRSHAWRTTDELDVLDRECRNIHVVQLKGHLFFGNINQLSDYVRGLFEDGPDSASSVVESPLQSMLSDDIRPRPDIRFLVLDFTLVVGLDSSAADRLTKIKYACDTHNCKIVFTAVPPAYEKFTEHLIGLFGDNRMLHIASDLDSALEWCENDILGKNISSKAGSPASTCAADEDEFTHLRNLRRFMPDQPLSVQQRLLDYFRIQEIDKDEVVWRQGDTPDVALLLVDGALTAVVEEEAGTTEEVSVGSVVGEMCFLTGEKRKTSLIATKRSVVYVLDRKSFTEMLEKDCYLAFLFQGISLRYTSYRLQYVGNRIWETKCLPI